MDLDQIEHEYYQDAFPSGTDAECVRSIPADNIVSYLCDN